MTKRSADVFTKEERSRVMSRVKSSGNRSTELALLAKFKENHLTGWRRNFKLFGKPDFVFLKEKIAVFVDGCFWHGHDCRNLSPVSNQEYWQAKIIRNKARDKKVCTELKNRGWKVVRLWECSIRSNNSSITRLISKVKSARAKNFRKLFR